MRRKTMSLVLASILSISSLMGFKGKKDNLDVLLDSLETHDDLKQTFITYQEQSILSETSRVFEHRCSEKVDGKDLKELLNTKITELEKTIIKNFITDNKISDEGTLRLPENTSIGYIVSNRINKCSVEVDIQFTKDNVPVLFHDEDLSKATNNIITRKIKDFTYDELKKIKVFYNQKNYSYIPTLEEILTLHSNDEYYSILLEIKTRLVKDFLNNYKKKYNSLNILLSDVEDTNRTYLMSGDQFFILKHYEDFKELGIKTGITIYNSSFLREFILEFDDEHYDFISLNIESLNHDLILSAIENKKALFIGSSSKKNIAKIVKLYKYLNIYENFYVLTDQPGGYDELMLEMEKQKTLTK